jgi:hypothetical protein
MYTLILTIAMWGFAGTAGMGGASVEVHTFDTEAQCETVKNEFLNNMEMTDKEMTGGDNRRIRITRKASCVHVG